MKVSLTDGREKFCIENPSYVFREQYRSRSELTSFFEEDRRRCSASRGISRARW